jgi:hypothetical protein
MSVTVWSNPEKSGALSPFFNVVIFFYLTVRKLLQSTKALLMFCSSSS